MELKQKHFDLASAIIHATAQRTTLAKNLGLDGGCNDETLLMARARHLAGLMGIPQEEKARSNPPIIFGVNMPKL